MQQLLRSAFHGAIIANGGLDAESGEEVLTEAHLAEAMAFGVPFLANPDLPLRLASGADLNLPDVPTFYQGGEKGYVDYPSLQRRRESPESPRVHASRMRSGSLCIRLSVCRLSYRRHATYSSALHALLLDVPECRHV